MDEEETNAKNLAEMTRYSQDQGDISTRGSEGSERQNTRY